MGEAKAVLKRSKTGNHKEMWDEERKWWSVSGRFCFTNVKKKHAASDHLLCFLIPP